MKAILILSEVDLRYWLKSVKFADYKGRNRLMTVSQTYLVAGHLFSIEMEDSLARWNELENYEPFKHESQEGLFRLKVVKDVDAENLSPLYLSARKNDNPRIDVYSCDGGYYVELAPSCQMDPVCWLKCSQDFSEACLQLDELFFSYSVNNSVMLLFAFRAALFGSTLEMHSSVVVNGGKAYMFLGNSGTGKSTHSALWIKNVPGTFLLNDDDPVLRIINGKAIAHGTPWSGKTPCYRNESYPVGAIVRLRQAPVNAIRRCSVPEAYASVSSASSGLKTIKGIADGLFSAVSAVISSVPCYSLDCLPDADAALLCFKTVAGGLDEDVNDE